MPGHPAPRSPPGPRGPPGGLLPGPFQFQPRRQSVDWRRLSAIDVERVARELDVMTLQETITGVTFCNLDAERCAHCQQPVDPVLLKVLKLAQLTIEYLLHSQDWLSGSVALLEEQLRSALDQREGAQRELGRQAQELKGLRDQSRRRKKMIATQQLLLQAGVNNYHKCHLCDKTFLNYSYLQAHIQRRHVEVTEAERQKKKQVEQMEDGLEELRVKLKRTESQLEAEREDEKRRRAQESEQAHQREEEAKREFDKWKEEERTKLHQEIDSLRQLFLSEFRDITSKNSSLEGKLQALQSQKPKESNLGTLQDDGNEDRRRQEKELRALREKAEQQKMEWKRKMKELQGEHLAEKEELKGENERLRATLSRDQKKATDHFHSQMLTLNNQLREQAKVIKSQEEVIKKMSLRKTKVIQHVSKAANEKEESTEEELEDSLDRKQQVLEALRSNPNLLKQFRPILEETLEEKLESMGVKRGTKGISAQALRNLGFLIKTQQEHKAKKFPELLSLRERLGREVSGKARQRQKNEDIVSQPPSIVSDHFLSPAVSHRETATLVSSWKSPSASRQTTPKPRTARMEAQSEPPRPTPRRKVSGPARLPESPRPAPKPAPRRRTHSTTTLPGSPALQLSTSPFSSEGDSDGSDARRGSPGMTRPQRLRQAQPPSRLETRVESEWSLSDTDASDGKAIHHTGAGVDKMSPSGTVVLSMAQNLERQLSTPGRKPAGGVRLFPTSPVGLLKTSSSVKKPQLSAEDSDLEISSLEDITQDLDLGPKAERPSLPRSELGARHRGDSMSSQATSVWTSDSARVAGW
ncbi:zinc finger protein DZIP1L [Tachyglossus aculeatus]|uniref:zinc finger protein DZIP1L n=1 Tax=Tachyglossus aculeatus TaxID=9261 RepID=UPI0018F3BEED|nr:zinc finger protein DZIP1L [Tachyglossus aculeatus]